MFHSWWPDRWSHFWVQFLLLTLILFCRGNTLVCPFFCWELPGLMGNSPMFERFWAFEICFLYFMVLLKGKNVILVFAWCHLPHPHPPTTGAWYCLPLHLIDIFCLALGFFCPLPNSFPSHSVELYLHALSVVSPLLWTTFVNSSIIPWLNYIYENKDWWSSSVFQLTIYCMIQTNHVL